MILSHPAEGNFPAKPLVVHLQNVAQKCKSETVRLNLKLDSLISQDKLANLAYMIGVFHDLGKASSFFQKRLFEGRRNDNRANHGLISALTAYSALENEGYNGVFRAIAFLVIVRHHGALENFTKIYNPFEQGEYTYVKEIALDLFKRDISEIQNLYPMDLKPVLKKLSADGFNDVWKELNESFEKLVDDENSLYFFIASLLFSMLIDYDKKDAARLVNDYFDGNLNEELLDPFPFIEDLRKENPKKFPDSKINQLRNRFLEQIDKHSEILPSNHLYLISAPTGIGKTFGALVFANRLKSKLSKDSGRLIYCLPYTSIIEQNFDEFEKVIRHNLNKEYEETPSRYLIKHHYLSLKKIKNRVNEDDYNYDEYRKDVLFIESWESAVVVTTFVQLFHSVFGTQNRLLKKVHHIAGSIIILDEVQNIDPKYYSLIRMGLKILSEYFNCYFLLMTATQPKIFIKEDNAVELVKSSDFMMDEVFNRVELDIRTDHKTVADFAEEFLKEFSDDNVLLVMNTKKSAFNLCEILENKVGEIYKIYCLTTLLIPKDRQKIIGDIKKLLESGKKVIVVSTQLVEAGVDFSFKRVYRDYAPLDSIIQTAGRCNRNGELGILGGKMSLLHLKEDEKEKTFDTYIYTPILLQYMKDVLTKPDYESKDFAALTDNYYKKFDFKSESKKLLEAIDILDYSKINEFKLIEDDYANCRILVLSDESAEKDFIRQQELLKIEMNSKELLEFELIKLKLKQYELSLTKKDFNNSYHDSMSEDFGVIHFVDINGNYTSEKGIIFKKLVIW